MYLYKYLCKIIAYMVPSPGRWAAALCRRRPAINAGAGVTVTVTPPISPLTRLHLILLPALIFYLTSNRTKSVSHSYADHSATPPLAGLLALAMAFQSPLISIPRKTTTDVDWTNPIRSIIAHSYGEDPNTYAEECSVLQRCRQDAVRGAGSDQTGECTYMRWLCLEVHVARR
jgi:hypothetical protein